MSTVRSIARAPLLICDGCRYVLEPHIVSDESDPNKGLLVHETWKGSCGNCHYYYTIIVEQHDEKEEKPFG